jgi:orotidine-5'-phosphate decarboxylase
MIVSDNDRVGKRWREDLVRLAAKERAKSFFEVISARPNQTHSCDAARLNLHGMFLRRLYDCRRPWQNKPIRKTMIQDPVIIALDFQSAAESDRLVTSLGDSAGFYKVGMELYAAGGMDFVRSLIDRGKRVFLDLKYYDIGETVKRAVAVAARSGAEFLTIHAVGQVMRAAIEGRGDSTMKLLAVTVLTSFDQNDLHELGYDCSLDDLVSARVRLAMRVGVDGIVGSPVEARRIRAQAGGSAILVTPGVRSRGAAAGDQKRVATPAEAMRDGASYVVVGRQVTRSVDPALALAAIHDELQVHV